MPDDHEQMWAALSASDSAHAEHTELNILLVNRYFIYNTSMHCFFLVFINDEKLEFGYRSPPFSLAKLLVLSTDQYTNAHYIQ